MICPRCGSNIVNVLRPPHKIDEEVDQVLMSESFQCLACYHLWTKEWWVVWTPDGDRIVSIDRGER